MLENKKYKHLIIDCNEKLLSALQKMDAEKVKLLIVSDKGKYRSLLSIGDIQRAIIQGKSVQENQIKNIQHEDIVCRNSDSKESIKNKMLKIRAQFMPVLNENNDLVDVYFWDDIFQEGYETEKYKKNNIPVVIMAGGKGTRLKPLTNIIPKPLIPYGDKTIIEKIIDNFCKYGFHNFYISVNYMSHMIESYFDNIKNKNYSLHFYKENEPKGTAGSLSIINEHIDNTFIVSNCDILIDQDYTEVLSFHKENKNDITAVTAIKSFKLPYGAFQLNNRGAIEEIVEKPEFIFNVNTGMYVIEPHMIERIPKLGLYHITSLISDTMKSNGKVGIFPVSENSWTDIGEWNLYEKFFQKK